MPVNRTHPTDSKALALEATRLLHRVRKKGGGKRLQRAHMYPELVKLRAKGWTFRDMAHYIGEAGGPKTTRAYEIIFQKESALREPRDTRVELKPDIQAMCQWKFEAFKAFFLRYSPHDYFPAHVEPWIRAFLQHRRLMLNVPPGHAKSEFFMIWIPVWLICRNRDVQILLVSNGAEDAANWAMEIAGQLEFNPDLVHDFGRFKPETVGDTKWAQTTFSVWGRQRKVRGAQFTVESRGMTSRVLGRRADFVIVDDPTRQEDAASAMTRDQQLKHLRQQVFTRAEPEGEFEGGRIVVIGQRVHIRDLYGELERQEWEIGALRGKKAWHVQKYPAVLDPGDAETGRPMKTLWPQRWNQQEIEQAYADVGGYAAFETMYQQNPVPEGTAIVQASWIEACKDRSRGAGQGPRGERDGNAYLPIVRVLSMDPSPDKFNGFIVGDLAATKDNFYFYVTEVHRQRAGVREAQMLVDDIIARTRPDYFIYESSTVTKWLRDDPWFLNLDKRIRTVVHKTGVNKNTAEFGVQSLAGDFEFARLSLPYGDDEARKMTDLLAREALVYPDGDTDDLLMALWFVKFNYRKLVPIRVFGDTFTGRMGGGWSFLAKQKDSTWSGWGNDRDRRDRERRKVSVA